MGTRRRHRRATDESGQVLVLSAIAMVVLLGMVGFALDIGHAYLVQRHLQAGVDAAALAGAQELPDPTLATQVADAYGPSQAKNSSGIVGNAETSVEMRCVRSAPGCSSVFGTYNAVNVKSTSHVSTFFAKVLGIDSLTVKAQATACSPCAAKPLDIMLVLDRTGSMCDDSSCSDLENARRGIKQFLTYMDPDIDHVGLAVFPPALPNNRCAKPTQAPKNWNYDTTDSRYVISSLQDDYLLPDGSLNGASNLVQMLDCTQAAGRTSYADAIEESMTELATHGRGDVQDVIVFLSDGAANTGSKWRGNDTPYRLQPCHQGVWSASTAKSNNMLVYTIGYGLAPDANSGEQCHPYFWGGSQQSDPESPPILAREALAQMATDDRSFFDTPDDAQLAFIYARIAADISRPAARLIDDSAT